MPMTVGPPGDPGNAAVAKTTDKKPAETAVDLLVTRLHLRPNNAIKGALQRFLVSGRRVAVNFAKKSFFDVEVSPG